MPKRTGEYDRWMVGQLTDPRLAASYINAAMAEDASMLKVALRNVAKAHTMKKVAKKAGVARERLYASLSATGNPTLANLIAILNAVGLAVQVVANTPEAQDKRLGHRLRRVRL
jgi:probable addiction module antidote protein